MLDFVKDMIVQCHTASCEAGWWDDAPIEPRELAKYLGVKVALIHSEISEMWEATSGPDANLPQHMAWEVERADVFIRACDMLGFLISHGELPMLADRSDIGVRFPKVVSGFVGDVLTLRPIEKLVIDSDDGLTFGTTEIFMSWHLEASRCLESLRKGELVKARAHLLRLAFVVAFHKAFYTQELGHTFKQVVRDKLAYNNKRADHKTENREKSGGKIF